MKGQQQTSGNRQDQQVVTKGPKKVLSHLGHRATRESQSGGQAPEPISEDDQVSRFLGDLGAIAHSHAKVGGGKRGSVIDPISNHGHRPRFLGQKDPLQLLLGSEIPSQLICRQSDLTRQPLDAALTVTTEQTKAQSLGPQAGQGGEGLVPGTVLQANPAQQNLVRRHRQQGSPVLSSARQRRRNAEDTLVRQPLGATHPELGRHPIDEPNQTIPRHHFRGPQVQQGKFAVLGLLVKGVREGMATGLLKTGGQLDQSIGADPGISLCGDPLQSQPPIKNQWSCRHGCDQGASRRQGARLVKQHGFQTRRGLHGIPSPEQEARTGGQAKSDSNGGGGGQP